jgi:hypothetical protein
LASSFPAINNTKFGEILMSKVVKAMSKIYLPTGSVDVMIDSQHLYLRGFICLFYEEFNENDGGIHFIFSPNQ